MSKAENRFMAKSPLYKKIKSQIIQSLIANEWRPGEMIPNEKQLAERFGVAISTIRAAIGELVVSDVLTRIQGKGTFVTHHANKLNAYRFFNLYQSDGVKASFYREIIRIKTQVPNATVAALLKLSDPGENIYKLRIHISSRNTPIAVSDLIVPARLFPDLGRSVAIEGDNSLYALFQTHYNINVVRVVERLSAVKASAAVAKGLGLNTAEPVLQVERSTFTFNDQPIEIRTTWVHTKNHHYLINRGDDTL